MCFNEKSDSCVTVLTVCIDYLKRGICNESQN